MRPDLSRQQKREKSWLKHNIRKLNKVDTTYIEPQRYNYAFMIQNTNTYELYRIKSNLGYSVTFAPNMSLRVGPYFGYRWIFIGYTIDVTHLYDEVNDRTDFNLSLYSNKIGLDLYYRKTGDGYYIRSSYFGDDFNTEPLRDVKFGGVTTSNKGFNAYYIFNHRKFSYPAAFSQSTVQRRSAGSPLIGIGYSNQNVTVDWRALRLPHRPPYHCRGIRLYAGELHVPLRRHQYLGRLCLQLGLRPQLAPRRIALHRPLLQEDAKRRAGQMAVLPRLHGQEPQPRRHLPFRRGL